MSKRMVPVLMGVTLLGVLSASTMSQSRIFVPASLPAWFTANRVHGHTRLTLSDWHDFTGAAAGFKSLGAHVFTRHAKTGGEDPWWPTGNPQAPNVVKQFIDSAHAEGLRIFTYYWHMSEKSLHDPHQEWICKTIDGETIPASGRGIYLDMTGPYRELVLQRLLDLAAMGADGLFFDFRHLPPRGCWDIGARQTPGGPAPARHRQRPTIATRSTSNFSISRPSRSRRPSSTGAIR